MKNNLKKLLVLLLAANMFAGATLPTFAEEVVPGTTTETVENADGTETTVTTNTTVTPKGDGTTDITIEITKTTDDTADDGTKVEGEEYRKETTTTDKDDNEIHKEIEYRGEETRTDEDGGYTFTGYEGGSEKNVGENGIDNVTVDVPLTEGETNTVTGRPAGSVTVIDGEKPEVPGEGNYDYTTETVVKPGKVTVTNNGVTVTENVTGTDLEYVYNETKPTNGDTNGTGDNELFVWVHKDYYTKVESRIEYPEEGEEIELEDGYAYKYLGSGLTSQYLPVYLYTTPGADDPDEEPYILNGKEYYFRGQGQKSYDKIYADGEKTSTETYNATFAVPQQFVLVDGTTGELITAYCADIDTSTENGFNYNIENLEDADYYDDEQAAMIRTIAANGYWGAIGTEIDENGNEVPAAGSLEAMKKMLEDSGEFSEDELKYLTDGVALSATQMAIWNFSNQMNVEYRTAVHTKDHTAENGEFITYWASSLVSSYKLNEEEEKATLLMYKVYNYLINMDPTAAENEDGIKESKNNIINADNFVKDMEITVIEKAEGHKNNQNDEDTDDAYVTNITFALEVVPSTANGDDLIVRVIGCNADGSTYEVASARLAGENKEGENYQMLESEDGTYKFENITIIEGDHTFNITLEGIQNLEKGVYLYTSEVRTEEDGSETSSQTLVGIAEGQRGVNVSMNINFSLNVEDEVVATEHVWHREWHDDPQPPETPENPPETPENPPETPENPPETPENPPETPETFKRKFTFKLKVEEEPEIVEIPEEEIPLVNIPDEEIPLTNIPDEPVPLTGDSMFWYISSAAAVLGLCVLNLLGKKKNHNA